MIVYSSSYLAIRKYYIIKSFMHCNKFLFLQVHYYRGMHSKALYRYRISVVVVVVIVIVHKTNKVLFVFEDISLKISVLMYYGFLFNLV